MTRRLIIGATFLLAICWPPDLLADGCLVLEDALSYVLQEDAASRLLLESGGACGGAAPATYQGWWGRGMGF